MKFSKLFLIAALMLLVLSLSVACVGSKDPSANETTDGENPAPSDSADTTVSLPEDGSETEPEPETQPEPETSYDITQKEILEPVGEACFNVKDYGAVGDGKTDDGSAIQAAAQAAQTARGVLYFPEGTYLVGKTITLSRNDALTGAAEVILAVERLGREYAPQRIVATVGKCDVINGAMNIVPGHVELYVDIRGIDREIVSEVVTKLHMELSAIASQRNLRIDPCVLSQETPVKLDDDMAEFLVEQCLRNMLTFLHMTSGAGHDTMYMSKLTRSTMFFVPCEKGISHNKEEAVTDDAVQNGLRLMYATLVRICTLDPKDERDKAEMDRMLFEEAYQ